jgi:hypothetical protein
MKIISVVLDEQTGKHGEELSLPFLPPMRARAKKNLVKWQLYANYS